MKLTRYIKLIYEVPDEYKFTRENTEYFNNMIKFLIEHVNYKIKPFYPEITFVNDEENIKCSEQN